MLKIYKDKNQIKNRIDEMANKIASELKNNLPMIIGVHRDCFIFYADLIRKIDKELKCEFISTDKIPNINFEVKDMDVVIVYGIAPEKELLKQILKEKGAEKIITLSLAANHKTKNNVDDCAFATEFAFEGYGLGKPTSPLKYSKDLYTHSS